MPPSINLKPGDAAPWFIQRTTAKRRFAFDTAGGRYLVLCFFGSAADDHSRQALQAVEARRRIFDEFHAAFFGVTNDPEDEIQKRVADSVPGLRFFLDFDKTIARGYGTIKVDAEGTETAKRMWVVLDPQMRVMRVDRFAEDRSDIAAVLDYVAALPPPGSFVGLETHAPILVLPNVFDAALCAKLIGLYETHGGTMSGFMREVGGRTLLVEDPSHKVRKDHIITDADVIKETQAAFFRTVFPQIMKVHQFRVTQMERQIVCCYDAEDQAHFNPHRDNTTRGTAHRRFAVSVNLNDDFDGGEVWFPEYGRRSYKAPAGGAVVFSCSLLHGVTKMTRGRRFAFLPFLYDETARKIREENVKFLADPKPAVTSAPPAA